jgi:hypothetical protein
MSDRPAKVSDRVSELQEHTGLNSETAGLNLCSPAFNDAYKDAMSFRSGKPAAGEPKLELTHEVEEKLSRSGYSADDVTADPKAHKAAADQAETGVKDDIIQAEYMAACSH